MGDKKRKATVTPTEIPTKKSKKSKTATTRDDPKKDAENPNIQARASMSVLTDASVSAPDAIPSKKSRKRAADFMSDEESASKLPEQQQTKKSKSKKKADVSVNEPTSDQPATLKAKKSKKDKKAKQHDLLTADGVNGVVERPGHEDLETATSHKPKLSSMQAEAERTVDQELKNDFGGVSDEEEGQSESEIEIEDNAAALLAGFDSDNEDNDEDANLDSSTALKLSKKKQKEVRKKLSQQSENNEGPGTVYVGRIPHGFYEKQMREYFSQFGEISKLRLSRNKYTGASKHFAFIEFASNDVAKIVAETMDNYLLFGHILKCKYAQPDSLHPEVWKGANKKFRKIPHDKLERERLAAPKTEQEWSKKVARERVRRSYKASKLASLGLELPASSLTNPSQALAQQKIETVVDETPRQIEGGEAGPTGAIKSLNGLPKDEIAIKHANEPEESAVPGEKKKSKRTRQRQNKKSGTADTAQAIENGQAEIDPVIGDKSEKSSKVDAVDFVKQVQQAVDEAVQADAIIEDVRLAVDEAVQAEKTKPATTEAEASTALAANQDEKTAASPAANAKTRGKKERKNLVKAKGPKSGQTSTKPAAPPTNTLSKRPGVEPLGKNKYDKAKRLEHKQAKANAGKGPKASRA